MGINPSVKRHTCDRRTSQCGSLTTAQFNPILGDQIEKLCGVHGLTFSLVHFHPSLKTPTTLGQPAYLSSLHIRVQNHIAGAPTVSLVELVGYPDVVQLIITGVNQHRRGVNILNYPAYSSPIKLFTPP